MVLAKRIRTWIEEEVFGQIDLLDHCKYDAPILDVLKKQSVYEKQMGTSLLEVKMDQKADFEYATQVINRTINII